jgi:cell division control protein 7
VLLEKFQLEDVRHYLYNLLKGLARLKALGIYHRDLKPSNFLYNPSHRHGIITDFGLSEVDPSYVAELEARAKHES